MSDPFLQLDTLLTHIWERLVQGARVADDPFRFVTLATVGENGPEARTVGLRAADRKAGTIVVHSDIRTAKVRSLSVDSRAEILCWDRIAQLQVRLSVTMTLLPADAARWSKIPRASRLNYGTDPAPGEPVGAPEDVTRTPDVARFMTLLGRARTIDVVSLAHDPHRRAVFNGTSGRWVAP